MLTEIHLGHLAAYRDSAQASNLATVNFFFGANGSGKTSITKAISAKDTSGQSILQWDDPQNTLEPSVYNRDYIFNTLHSSSTLPGVFALGRDSSKALQRIDELTAENGEIVRAERKARGLRSVIDGKEGKPGLRAKLSDAWAAFEADAWKVRNSLSPQIRGVLTGSIGAKASFAQKSFASTGDNPNLNREPDGAPESHVTGSPFALLTKEIDELEDEDSATTEEISRIGPSLFETFPAIDLLGVPVVSTADSPLARKLRSSGSIDWAVQGIPFLDHDRECPMCRRGLSQTLLDAITGLSDEQYASDVEQLGKLKNFISQRSVAIGLQLDACETALTTNSSTQAAFAAVRASLTAAEVSISDKAQNPSNIAVLPNVDSTIAELNRIVDRENTSRTSLREKRASLKDSRSQYASDAWSLIAQSLIGEASTYKTLEKEVEGQISAQEERIASADSDLNALREELIAEQNSIRTHLPWMDEVNDTLARVGFRSFHFKESASIDGAYTIVRPDGSIANNTLSEGERTFVSFLYYISALSSVPEQRDESHYVAIIDDPIASLDSDIMFFVSALIKKLASDIHAGSVPVKQLLLLTHNIHFLKEVSYVRRGESTANRAFFVLNKTPDGTMVSARGTKNPVDVEYVRLWKQVGEWRDADGSGTGIQNAMRRIIEFYFQTIGRVDEQAIIADFLGDEAIIAKSFFSWINEGSHSLFDGLHFSPSATSSNQYYKIFEEIFIRSGHEGHFLMMTSTWD